MSNDGQRSTTAETCCDRANATAINNSKGLTRFDGTDEHAGCAKMMNNNHKKRMIPGEQVTLHAQLSQFD